MADTESGKRGSSALKWGVAVIVLAAGYADLARGGATVAPILLVIGYGILVPVAIVS
jgi:energy-converting hydrogenase Eha subunit C